jgi:endoglucanase
MFVGACRLVALATLGAASLGCRQNVYIGDPIDRADHAMPDGPSVVPDAEPPDAEPPDANADADADVEPPYPWYLHAVGSKIFDSNDAEVHIRGISWWGMQAVQRVPEGLHRRTLESIVDQIDKLGFNLIRVPFSNDAVADGSMPMPLGGVDSLAANPDMAGLTSLEVLDKVIEAAFRHRIRVILDRYRFQFDDRSPPPAKWYSGADPESPGYPESRWIQDWVRLASRYAANPNMVGCDLHDEPAAPSTWGDGNPNTDFRLAAETAGNQILATNPNLVIVVEGVDVVNGETYWPGGNLLAAQASPVRLTSMRQLIYSIHEYGKSVKAQPWFADASYPDNLQGLWDHIWGYLVTTHVTPVVVGAFGDRKTEVAPADAAIDDAWRQKLMSYIAANQLGFVFWGLNPSAEGRPGLLQIDWETPDPEWSALLGIP